MGKFLGLMIGLTMFITPIAAWLTHIVFCFKTAAWGFLIAGAVFFPIGIFHGIYLWFV